MARVCFVSVACTYFVCTKASAGGMGTKRNRRYAIVLQDGIITYFGVDKRGVSAASAESVLAHLGLEPRQAGAEAVCKL